MPNTVKQWLTRTLNRLKQIRSRHRDDDDDSYKVSTKLAEKHARRVAAFVTPEMIPSDLDHDHLNEAILKVAYNSQSPGVAVAASGLLSLGPGGHELSLINTEYKSNPRDEQVAFLLLQEYRAEQDALREAILYAISDEDNKEDDDDDNDDEGEDVESSCKDLAGGTRVRQYEDEEEEGDEGEGETAEAQAVEEDDDDEEEEDDEDEEDGEEEG